MNWRPEFPHVGRAAAAVAVGVVLVMVLSLAIVGALIGGGSVLFGAGQNCSGGTFASANGAAPATQPTASAAGRATIPADYLHLYQQAGKKYGVPWVVLAGIGEVETQPGPHIAARRAQRGERVRRRGPDADRHRRRVGRQLGRQPGPPGQRAGRRGRHRRQR